MKSMTGFASVELSAKEHNIRVDIKSLNSKYAKFAWRYGSSLPVEFEIEAEKLIRQKVYRGSIFVSIKSENKEDPFLDLNLKKIETIYNKLEKFNKKLKNNRPLNLIDIISLMERNKVSENDNKLQMKKVLAAINKALNILIKMRVSEGKKIEKELSKHLEEICKLKDQIQKRANINIKEHMKKIKERISQLLTKHNVNISNDDILKQAAIFADKIDISEEIERINFHINEFKAYMQKNIPIGKTLTFICQELFREFNTISSKAVDMKILAIVVTAKNELEKIREQVQNVE